MKKRDLSTIAKLLLASLLTLALASCKEPTPPSYEAEPTDLIVLNQGKFGSNNSSITAYNLTTKKAQQEYYTTINREALGDSGHDMIVYGSKVYINIYGSNRIIITDLGLKKLGEINPLKDNQPQSPRYLTALDGKVYATLYDGHVARIDTTSLAIDKQVAVPINCEQIKVSQGKLFVAISDGMAKAGGKTVLILDKELNELKSVEVGLNPQKLAVDNEGFVYVQRSGDYQDDKGDLSRIDPNSYEVTKIADVIPAFMTVRDNELLTVSSTYNEKWEPTYSFEIINTKTLKLEKGKSFLDEDAMAEIIKLNPQSIDYIPNTDMLYIGASDYKVTGKMFVVDKAGKLNNSFPISINPACIQLISK